MKYLWLYSVRAYIRLGLFFYFKKVVVHYRHHIPKKGPVLFLANHQNALLDALLIATKSGRFSYFLTRASVFNKPWIATILKSLRMLPVYRIRDGWANLSKNNAVFSKSSKLLADGHALVIFPEGSHNLKRTVRPLSKGFTRIIHESLTRYPNTELQLVPVGLNFQNATQFGDTTALLFGKPIGVSQAMFQAKNAHVHELKTRVFDALCDLTTHINSNGYDDTLKNLQSLNVDFTKPELVNDCIKSSFKTCPEQSRASDSLVKKIAKILLIVALPIPYVIWKILVQPRIQELEFTATFRFAIALTLVPLFMLVVALFLGFVVSINWAILYVLVTLLLDVMAVKL